MLYFAFGMNLDPEYMWDATAVGPAYLDGYELFFSYFASIRPKEGGTVPGGLWRISERHLASLDGREGYVRGREFNHYDRLELPVRTPDGEVTAIVYVMTESALKGKEETPPGWGYYDIVQRGYRFFGLDDEPLAVAAARAYDLTDPGWRDEPHPATLRV